MQLKIFDEDEAETLLPEVSPDYRVERNLARAAEYLVAFDISRRGLDCFLAGEGLRYDLIADVGGLRRIQVKMNRRAVFRAPGSVFQSYTFGSKEDLRGYIDDIDLFAFVAMDRQTVIYSAPSTMRRQAFHIKASIMTPEACDVSWTDATRGWLPE